MQMSRQIDLASSKETMNKNFISDPHRFFGLQPKGPHSKLIRIWRPGASYVHLEVFGKDVEAKRSSPEGLFEYEVPANATFADYRIYHQNGMLAHDPYAFLPTFGEMDAHLFNRGVHYKLYEVMGGRLCVHQGIEGAKFAIWAPEAQGVSLVGDFNYWDGRVNPMRVMGSSGVWELFIPGLKQGEKYKFEIRTRQGHIRLKSDPYALGFELRPKTAAVLCDVDHYPWGDQEWMQERGRRHRDSFPMTIYEVHLGSWKKHGWRFYGYRELAVELAKYCKEMGFTHVELLPIQNILWMNLGAIK